jgi:hypothetical protein
MFIYLSKKVIWQVSGNFRWFPSALKMPHYKHFQSINILL